jgi:trehalose 6-phosphate phosphatase
MFDELVRLAGPTLLLSEEYCPQTQTALGNYPQVYSHVGIIDAAVCLSGQDGE